MIFRRKQGQSLVIDAPGTQPIVITVVRVRGPETQLRISAPDNVAYRRAEITKEPIAVK